MVTLEELVAAAHGELEADLILEGAEVVNLFSGKLHRSDVAVYHGFIVGFDSYSTLDTQDLSGRILAPGFIDGHVHVESAMVTIPEYARAVVPKGTTSVVIDPHEIANVWGEAGIKYILDSSRDSQLNVFIMLPSCVPATRMETSGAYLDADIIAKLMYEDRVLGLAEVMNYPGVILREPDVLKKIRLAKGKRIDGHAPSVGGKDLSAYIAAGIRSDHESTSLEEAEEKLRQGMCIMIREGSAAKNLKDLLPLVTPRNARQFVFVSDDRHPADILKEGHIDYMVKTSIEAGLDPILAFQMSSLNAAQYFGLNDLGAIAPGYKADIIVLDELQQLRVVKVLKDGKIAAENGYLTVKLKSLPNPKIPSIKTSKIDIKSFSIPSRSGNARVIGIIPGEIITRSLMMLPKVTGGFVISDVEKDILKIAVIERHMASGNVGMGLVQGFKLKQGSLATSFAHDSHNIVIVGTNDLDMLKAYLSVKQMGGGLTVVSEGKVEACMPLTIAGLLSDKQMQDVADGLNYCIEAARDLGCDLIDPFMTLSFLSLPVIPELKLTDKGLVDVNKFQLVRLFSGIPN